jgi:glycosyltransferase involved in cell wall biosynthesis
MRVLLACAAFPPFGRGGGPIASELIARSIVDQGAKVRVLVVGDTEAFEQRDGMEITTLPSLNIYRDWLKDNSPLKKVAWHAIENFNPRAYARVRKELEAFRPDVLVTVSVENINVASWAAARSLGIPCVHIAHSYFLMCWRGSLFRAGVNCTQCASCKVFSIGKRYLSRYVDALITETDFLRRVHQAAGYFPNAATYVIPSALDAPVAPPRAKPPGLRVGYIGTHTRNKGIETLAAAAKRLIGRPGIRFLVAGTGDDDYTAELRRSFPQATTTFAGWVRPETFYPEIDVVVVPSIWREPFGRVSIEGNSYGVPALVARSGGLPENVEHGHDGFVFEPQDDSALADLLARLETDSTLYDALSEGARARAGTYAVEAIGDRTLSCLEEVVSKKAQRNGP